MCVLPLIRRFIGSAFDLSKNFFFKIGLNFYHAINLSNEHIVFLVYMDLQLKRHRLCDFTFVTESAKSACHLQKFWAQNFTNLTSHPNVVSISMAEPTYFEGIISVLVISFCCLPTCDMIYCLLNSVSQSPPKSYECAIVRLSTHLFGLSTALLNLGQR